ncbi:bifunctional folylpolyglutamate synthase/dihydrofolate synthase [Clostridium gasigenes]|uniref:bifunctional folylpolyglutamate synthase/dihydrofolate synthase n=1 Tax=Clostridium gasigenes TaxID=94869 RepID=UPI00143852BA|nr:folylpolyglutamate synthase/dihydrofolate synthase family protein [Clostridium gasigenes]NKF08363.1 bifunctional folylpolyglutamate synthase/dihydrofolate synthase [Clostridium gasigenes]QSW18673.1 bifunctional folylpolyglutamate synthase/dihydrofolate synthase [Clostridium gasigenes]
MKYEDAMKYITEVGNFGSNYGLKRTFRLLELLGNPQNKIKLIHIAGTNGKGSTTAMISKILMGNGYKVGMYTSPFLEEFEERIQINRVNIPKEKLANLMDELKIAVDKVIEEGYNHPTEFEIITCLMFLYFYKENIDFGVIEVGLGGRLDSTNVITPIISIITSISYDHTNILGNTLTKISREKSGIIKECVPVVIFPQEEEVLKVIKSKCKELNAPLHIINEIDSELIEILQEEKPYQKVKIKGIKAEYNIKLPLLGEHQILNLSLAIKAIELLEKNKKVKISKEILEKSLEDVCWNGRLEVMKKSPLVVLDGAHNIQGITTLKQNIEKYFKYKNIYLILGILADKDVEEMIKVITPMAKEVYAVTPNSIRAELAEDLKNEVLKYNENCIAFEKYEYALNKALEIAKEDDIIVACGSLYMVGGMRTIIKKL